MSRTVVSLTEGPVIDPDVLPPGQAVAAAVHRLPRMSVASGSNCGPAPAWPGCGGR